MNRAHQSFHRVLPLHPPDQPIQDHLLAALQRVQDIYTPFRSGSAVVVGVSGGADSVCLLHLLLQKAAVWSIELHVAHVDHGLRPTSAGDAAFVEELAREWGIPFHLQRLEQGSLARTAANLEAAARELRYRFLADVARTVALPNEAPLIAVAHTADDQAETLLMHLLRGSGLDGLAGMRPYRPLPLAPEQGSISEAIGLVRPLLDVSRTEIVHYLQAVGLTWCEDPSNRDLRFTRNWLRQEILPRMAARYPSVQKTLAQTAAILADEADRSRAQDQAVFQDLLVAGVAGERVVLRRSDFCDQDPAVQRGVLRHAWQVLGAADPMTFAHVEALRAGLSEVGANAGPFPISAGIAWSTVGDCFSLHSIECLPIRPDHPFLGREWRHEHGRIWLPVPGEVQSGDWVLLADRLNATALPAGWQTNPDPWQAYLDIQAVGAPALTTPHQGQPFKPLGLGGRSKSLGDLFTDRKIPPFLRAGWPVIVGEGGAVVWVCGLQVAHPARITAQTKEVLHLIWKRKGSK